MRSLLYNWKIYLDTCCLSRSFNDQTQTRIRRETEAIDTILGYFHTGLWYWVVSEVLAFEVGKNRNLRQRVQIESHMASVHRNVSAGTMERARAEELEILGFKWFDALHLACAESGNADVFLTTDDRLLRRAKRLSFELRLGVENPYKWLQEVIQNENPKDDR